MCASHTSPSFPSPSFVTLRPADVWRSGLLDWRVAQQLSTPADLLEDLDSIPSTCVTAHSICNPSPRESAALFWPQRAPDLQYSGWSQRPTLLQICTHSSESVFISPSFLKDIFPEFKILYRQHSSFGTLENVFAFSSGRYDFCWESHSLCIFVPNKEPVSIFGCFKFSFFVFRLVSVLVTLVWVWIFVYLAWDLLNFCSS